MKFFAKKLADFFETIFVFVVVFGIGITFIFATNNQGNYKVELASVLNSNENDILKVNEETTIVEDVFGGIGVADITATEESLQDILDDIAEKLDVIAWKTKELQNEQINNLLAEAEVTITEESDEELVQDEEIIEEDSDKESQSVYPKILISEIQVAGSGDKKQEFLELFNPNDFDVDLTGWSVKRKTLGSDSWSTYATPELFFGKTIQLRGYFLIARTGYYPWVAKEFTDNPITDNNSFVLKNPDGEVSDKLGFGNAQECETNCAEPPVDGRSIGRKVPLYKMEQDTDNNAIDFEANLITPLSKNDPISILSGGGGGTAIIDSNNAKILISEIQTLPTEKRFVELYNPNNYDVDLSGWYLQRKTENDSEFSSFVSSTNFNGKIITGGGYFLISREIEGSDILLNIALNENDFLVLKNLYRDDVDRVNWQEEPGENKSYGRKVLEDKSEKDTDDVLVDFEIQTPTPKFQNIKWEEPILPDLLSIEITTSPTKLSYEVGESLDISGLVVTGFYSDETSKIEEIIEEDIFGFDSSKIINSQIITITLSDCSAFYEIEIIADITPPSIVNYKISNLIISPNDDGIKDSTEIDLEFSEKVKYKIIIELPDKEIAWNGTAINPNSKNWDGKNKTGEQVLDGEYAIKISIEDSSGNIFEDESKSIILDTIAPVITLNGEPIINLNVGDVYEELRAETDDSSEIIITGVIDTSVEGNYEIFYDAVDEAGNSAKQIKRIVVITAEK